MAYVPPPLGPPGGGTSGPPSGPIWPPPPGWAGKPGNDGFSIASLVLGIIPITGGLLGVIFGGIALARIRRSGRGGTGFAIVGILTGSAWILLIAGAVILTAVGPPAEGEIRYYEAEVGDCIADLPAPPQNTLTRQSCEKPHLLEVFDTTTLSGSYPGDATVERQVKQRCAERLPEYVGAAPGEARYDIYSLRPSEGQWAKGRREAVCMLLAPDRRKLTGSAKGAGPNPK